MATMQCNAAMTSAFGRGFPDDGDMGDWYREIDGGVELRVKVVPGASRDRMAGLLGDALKIQVSAAPERGKANAAVEQLIADALGVPARHVRVTAGQTQARKTIRVEGVTGEDVVSRLSVG